MATEIYLGMPPPHVKSWIDVHTVIPTREGAWYIPAISSSYTGWTAQYESQHGAILWNNSISQAADDVEYISDAVKSGHTVGWYYYGNRTYTPIAPLNDKGEYGACDATYLHNSSVGDAYWVKSEDRIPTMGGVWYMPKSNDVFINYDASHYQDRGYLEWTLSGNSNVYINFVVDEAKALVPKKGWYLFSGRANPLVPVDAAGEYGAPSLKVLEGTTYDPLYWYESVADIQKPITSGKWILYGKGYTTNEKIYTYSSTNARWENQVGDYLRFVSSDSMWQVYMHMTGRTYTKSGTYNQHEIIFDTGLIFNWSAS